ncbi:MAG: hypothetical protein HY306_09665 [Nitrosomonadales bacterium]|nr:hypothetical protein [Nitrosomonadales bacterium]
MKYSIRNRFDCLKPGFMMIAAILIAGCATMEVSSVWKDPAYLSHPVKIMIVSMSKSPVNRRIFEDEFVHQLNAHGVEAVASYMALPDREKNDEALIAKKMAEQGADAVLITRLASKKTVQVYVPGTPYYLPHHYGKWRDYYEYGYDAMYTPGYVTENEYAVMETNLYDANNENLIWAASAETGILGSNRGLIASYIGLMMKNMVAQGLLGQ